MRTQQPLARAILIDAVYVLAFAILQVTVLPELTFLKVRPDLTLILSILTGYLFGWIDGMFLGLAAGFLRDMLAAGPWPGHAATDVCWTGCPLLVAEIFPAQDVDGPGPDFPDHLAL